MAHLLLPILVGKRGPWKKIRNFTYVWIIELLAVWVTGAFINFHALTTFSTNWQVLVSVNDGENYTFITLGGLYKFTRNPQWVHNMGLQVSSAYCIYCCIILSGQCALFTYITVLYLDPTVTNFWRYIIFLLKTIEDASLTINHRKCLFERSCFSSWLRHQRRRNTTKIRKKSITFPKWWWNPCKRCRALSVRQPFRNFVSGFSFITRQPLFKLRKKNVPWGWNSK